MTDSSSAYAEAAEFLDVAMAPTWRLLEARVRQALAGVPGDHPVVDIGAGTGRGVLAAARCVPDAPLVAVEPSAGLRAVLLARIGADPGLLSRTTVLPCTWSQALQNADVQLPQVWGAALALAMTGHLDPAERRGLFGEAARQPPARVEVVAEAEWGSVQVGTHTYSTSGRADPDGPDSVLWHITYRVHAEGRQLREVQMSHRWYVHGVADVVAEMEDVGLETEVLGDDLVLGRRQT